MTPLFQGYGGFIPELLGQTIHYEPGLCPTKMQLTKIGRGDNDSIAAWVRCSSDGSTWGEWEELPLLTVCTLASPGVYVQLKLTGNEFTTFYSKDERGVNIGVEIKILEVVAV